MSLVLWHRRNGWNLTLAWAKLHLITTVLSVSSWCQLDCIHSALWLMQDETRRWSTEVSPDDKSHTFACHQRRSEDQDEIYDSIEANRQYREWRAMNRTLKDSVEEQAIDAVHPQCRLESTSEVRRGQWRTWPPIPYEQVNELQDPYCPLQKNIRYNFQHCCSQLNDEHDRQTAHQEEDLLHARKYIQLARNESFQRLWLHR